jgi:hypothetical protein
MRNKGIGWWCGALIGVANVFGVAASAADFPLVGGLSAQGLEVPFYEELIPPQEGLRTVLSKGRVGLADADGNWVLPPRYGFALVLGPDRYMVWEDMQYGTGPMSGYFKLIRPLHVVDGRGNKLEEAPPITRDLESLYTTPVAGLFRYRAERGGQVTRGVLSADLKVAIPDAEVMDDESILIATADGRRSPWSTEKSSSYAEFMTVKAIYDRDGKLISDQPHLGNVKGQGSGFHQGLAVAYDEAGLRLGYIGPDGGWKIKPEFFAAAPFYDEVALVVSGRKGKYDYKGLLIDRNGERVASLPAARCYAPAENGRVFAQVSSGDGDDYGYLLDYRGKKVATIAGSFCGDNPRLRWIDAEHFVFGQTVYSANGETVRFGQFPFRYDRVERVDRAKGLLYVRAGADYAPGSLAQLRAMEANLYENTQLRPLGGADWSRLKEPDFHVYSVVRLYADESWQSGNSLDQHLITLAVEVKARDGRSQRDPQLVLATAGCRPTLGMRFIAEGVLVPEDRKKDDFVGYETFKAFIKQKTGAGYLVPSQSGIACDSLRLIDGAIPRPTATPTR